MRLLLGMLLAGLLTPNLLAQETADTLAYYHSRSDVIVAGEFVSEPVGESSEQGIVNYQADFKVTRHLKAPAAGKPLPAGTIKVNLLCFENEPSDRVPQLVKGGKAILFLNRPSGKPQATYVSADAWFAIQPANTAMLSALAAMFPDEPAAEEAVVTAGTTAAARNLELGGSWRVFLPGGYEYEMTLLDKGDQQFSLQPASLNIGGSYRLEGDRLISQGIDDNDTAGKYVWKIRSPYMLTLVEQTARVGSDYTGAVLFRPTAQALNGESKAKAKPRPELKPE